MDKAQHTTDWLARWHEMTKSASTPQKWLRTVRHELDEADGPLRAAIWRVGGRWRLTMLRNEQGHDTVAHLIVRPRDVLVRSGTSEYGAASLDDLRAALSRALMETAASWDRGSLVA